MQEYFPRQYTLHPRKNMGKNLKILLNRETPVLKPKNLTAVSPLRGRRWKHSSTLGIRE